MAYLLQDWRPAAVFDDIMQERRNGLVFVTPGFEDQGRYAQDVRDIGDVAAFARLSAVLLGGVDQGIFKAGAQL